MPLAAKKIWHLAFGTWHLAFGTWHWASGICLTAHQKEDIGGTKKVWLAAKKSLARVLEDFVHIFCC